MKKDYVQIEKNCQQCFLKKQGKIQLNQFKSINTQKTGIWESPKKQMQMIHHQGNAHVQLAQLLILYNLNLTVQNKQKENFYKTVTSNFTKHTTRMKNLTGESKQNFSNYMNKIKKKTNKQTSTLLTIQSIHKTVPRHALFFTHVKKGSLLDREKKNPKRAEL